jgi:hypothetical protein
MEPTGVDLRAAYLAHRRAGNRGQADILFERLLDLPVSPGDGWYTRVQLLTDAGEIERASSLLAAVARGDHPDALDPRRIRGEPSVRMARARARLERARAKSRRNGTVSSGAESNGAARPD